MRFFRQMLRMAARNADLKMRSSPRLLLTPVILLFLFLLWLTMTGEEPPNRTDQMPSSSLPLVFWFLFCISITILSLLSLKFRILRLLIVVLSAIPLLLTILFFLFRIPQLPNDVAHKHEFFSKWRVGGHRGSVHDWLLENSLDAFGAVKKEGGDLVEMDVELTKDGVPVICHDNNVANLTGADKEISKMTLEEFRQLRYLNTNISLPTFEEAVAHCIANDILMVWDVKTINHRILKRFVEMFRKHNLYSKVLISGWNPNMYLVKRADVNILTSYTFRSWELNTVDEEAKVPRFSGLMYGVTYALDLFGFAIGRSLLMPKFLGVDAIFCHVNDMSRYFQSDAASNNIHLAAWTSNNPNEQLWLRDYLHVPFLTDKVQMVPH